MSEWHLFPKWISRNHLWEVSVALFGDEQRTATLLKSNLIWNSENLWHLLISLVYICIYCISSCLFSAVSFPHISGHQQLLGLCWGGRRKSSRGQSQGYGQGRKSACLRACLCVFVLPGPFSHSSTTNPPEGDIVAVMNTDSCFLLHWDLSSVQIFGCRSFQRFKRVFDEIMQTWRPLKRRKLGSEHVVPVTASVLSTVQNSC